MRSSLSAQLPLNGLVRSMFAFARTVKRGWERAAGVLLRIALLLTALMMVAPATPGFARFAPGPQGPAASPTDSMAIAPPPAGTPEAAPALQPVSNVRYVRLQSRSDWATLEIAEVQVFNGATNLSQGKTATQSSTFSLLAGCPSLAEASKAVDGNTSGLFADCSVSHTNLQAYPWWKVDLGSPQTIDHIVLWNRTDACCTGSLRDLDIEVSSDNVNFRSIYYRADPAPARFDVWLGAQFVRVQLRAQNILSLAEVQVFQGNTNLALNRTASQSSTWPNACNTTADKAVDGNTNGDFSACSTTHTDNGDPAPWWQVNLGSRQSIDRVVLWNRTDSVPERLSNFDVLMSGDGINFTPVYYRATAAPTTLEVRLGVRFVKVQMRDSPASLELAEVQVFSGATNLALNQTATQSSTLSIPTSCPAPTADKAVDGNTNGFFDAACSVAHTEGQAQPWWQVDLGSLYNIDRIVVWNREDACCAWRLQNFDVLVSDDGVTFTPVHFRRTSAPRTLEITALGPTSGNANLSALTLSAGTLSPAFNANTIAYTATVASNVASVTVNATRSDSDAGVTINGEAVISKNVALNVGANTVTVVVTSTNGTVKTYTVVVSRSAPSNNLSALTLSAGTLSPAFTAGTTSYTATVVYATNSVTVNATAADITATVTINGDAVTSKNVSLNQGANTVTVVVTQPGLPSNTYTVVITRGAPSSNANLSNLTLDPGILSPAFNSGIISYSAAVGSTVATVNVTAYKADSTATVSIDGHGHASKTVSLASGPNTINVLVTAEDGATTKTYTVVVSRAPSGVTASNPFASAFVSPASQTCAVGKTCSANIMVTLPEGGYEANGMDVTLSFDAAKLQISSITAGAVFPTVATSTFNNTTGSLHFKATGSPTVNTMFTLATVVFTPSALGTSALDLKDVNESIVGYGWFGTGGLVVDGSITVTAAAANPNLSALTLDAGTLSPSFAPGTTYYSASVANSVTSVTVSATPQESTASVVINGEAGATRKMPLNTGANDISVYVTSPDGTRELRYTVTVTRAKSSNANLSALTASPATLSPAFASATTSYTASVANSVTSVTLAATRADGGATMTLNGAAFTGSKSVPLNVDANTMTVKVTAEDGSTVKTYTVTVTRARSSNANLSNLTLNIGSGFSNDLMVAFSPTFSSGTTAYTYTLGNGGSYFVNATKEDSTASVTINGVAGTGKDVSASALSTTVNITVTAQDGTTIKTYSITITRAKFTFSRLQSLALNAGSSTGTSVSLGQFGFSPAITTYTTSVGDTVSSLYVSASTHSNASIAINGTAGNERLVTLNPAGTSTVITVRVTAEDTAYTTTYSITVSRATGPDVALTAVEAWRGVWLADGTYYSTQSGLSVGGFVGGKYTISTTLSNLALFSLKAVARSATAVVSIETEGTWYTNSRNSMTKSIYLTTASTNAKIKVVDGSTTATYPVVIIKPSSRLVAFDRAVDEDTDLPAAGGTEVGARLTVLAADSTPPEVTPALSGTMGQHGWYTSVIEVRWLIRDAQSEVTEVTDDCFPTTIAGDTTATGVTITCSATSTGGTTTASVTVKRDATAPRVDATVYEGETPINPAVWSSQDLTVKYVCTETGSGLDGACASDNLVTAEGANNVVSAPVCDLAGNCATASITARIDRTGPALTLPVGLNPATGVTGLVLTYDAGATDTASGVLRDALCDRPSGSWFAVGTVTVTCEAVDNAGNSSTASFDVTVDFVPPHQLEGVPGNMTVSDETGAGAEVIYPVPTASDGSTVTCTPPAGSVFPLGSTLVSCSTPTGLSASFLVTVRHPAAPVIDGIPGTIVAEATGPGGAAVTYTDPTAVDSDNNSVPVSCEPASGSVFPLGTTVVECEATAGGHTATAAFQVIVQDTIAPEITGTPANQTAEATSAAGAAVTYTGPTATDIVDGSVTVDCSTASGVTFALGTTLVLCTAEDAHGNGTTVSFTVTVVDTTAPVVTPPADVVAEATGANGAAVSFGAATATDAVGVTGTVCTPASGATFALGTTTVTCEAQDAAGNVGAASFDVLVQDTTAPVVTVPANIVAEATSEAGAVVSFGAATATDAVGVIGGTFCSQVTGATFPLGTTTVTCEAQDAAGNVGDAAFTVTVEDTTPPAVTASRTPAANAAGWNNTPVTVTATGTDDGSGIASCEEVTLANDGAGQSATVSCTDNAGNTASATISGINVDQAAPALTVTAPATVTLGAAATATVTASDPLSGLVSDPSGTPALNTATVGVKTLTVTATDAAGNAVSKSVTYTVSYGVAALYDQSKAVRSGATVPIKLQLQNAAGGNVSSAAVTVTAVSMVRTSDQAPGTLEDAGNANPDNNFRYDADLGGYIYNLKTTGLATGTYRLSFTAAGDPEEHAVEFQVR